MPRIGCVLALGLAIVLASAPAVRAQSGGTVQSGADGTSGGGVAILYVRVLSDATAAGAPAASFNPSPCPRATAGKPLEPPPTTNGQRFAEPITFSPGPLAPRRPSPIPPGDGTDRRLLEFIFTNLAPGEYLLAD
jgi:hypothetical protein